MIRSKVTSVNIGEIHAQGAANLQNAKTFMLTAPARAQDVREGPEVFFGLLAAATPKKALERLADRCLEELRPVFFRDGSPEERFEAALKQANRTILGFLYEQSISIPGIQLRGAVCALSGDRLFVSGRGAMRGLLIVPQQGKLTPYTLFDENASRSNDPKFFSALQMGRLQAGGRLVVATTELFSELDEAFVKAAFVQPDMQKASRDVKNALRNPREAVAIMTLSTPFPEPSAFSESAPAAIAPAGAMPPRTIRPAAPALSAAEGPPPKRGDLPAGPDIGELLSRGLRAAAVAVGRALKSLISLTARVAVILLKAPVTLVKLAVSMTRAEARARAIETCKTAPERCLAAGVGRLNALPAESRVSFFLLLTAATIFVHGLLFSFTHELAAREVKAYEASLAELHALQTDFEAGLIYGNDQRSQELLSRMAALASALPEKTAAQRGNKTEAAAAVERGRERLRRMVRLEQPKTFASFTDAAMADGLLSRFKDRLYLFSRSAPSALIFDASGSSTSVALEGLPGGIAAAAPARTGFLLLDGAGHVHYWNPAGRATTEYPKASLDPASPILFYEGRLYNAEPGGMIVRRSVAARTLGAPANVLQAPLGAWPIGGLASDASVYALLPSGEVRKYLRGTPVAEFKPVKIEPALARAGALWTDPKSDVLAFIDATGDRAVLLDKTNGRLRAQLTAQAFAGLSSLAASENGKTLYLLVGSKIFEVPLDGTIVGK